MSKHVVTLNVLKSLFPTLDRAPGPEASTSSQASDSTISVTYAMPKVFVDIAFGRDSSHPVMYSLSLDRVNKSVHDNDLYVVVFDDTPRRLVGDGWSQDPMTGEINSGWLYRGVMKSYPKSPSMAQAAYETQVAVKWVRGQSAVESLRKEARMYEGILKPLQGAVVPTFYGLFVGKKDGVYIGCMLLEWCPGNDPATDGKPSEDTL